MELIDRNGYGLIMNGIKHFNMIELISMLGMGVVCFFAGKTWSQKNHFIEINYKSFKEFEDDYIDRQGTPTHIGVSATGIGFRQSPDAGR